MTSSSKCLLYFFTTMLNLVISVRIYKNLMPTSPPTRYVPFNRNVISKTCMLEPDEGPCRGNIKMYYYESELADCTTFKWGGCQGNGNRFNTHGECIDSCLSKEGAPRKAPKYCMLTYDYGYCFGAMERWYYDHVWNICKKTIYSGCGGNNNNFIHQEQCQAICVFRQAPKKYKKSTTDGMKKVIIINPGPTRINKFGEIVPDRKAGVDSAPGANSSSIKGADGKSTADGKISGEANNAANGKNPADGKNTEKNNAIFGIAK